MLLSVALGITGARTTTFPGDRWTAAPVLALGDPFAPIAAAFNDHMTALAVALAAVAIALAIRRHRSDLLFVIAFAALARRLLQIGRSIVDRPRPAGDFVARATGSPPAFPSGHALTAVLVFGTWFLLAPELLPGRWVAPVRVACVAAIALTALSRMWAGVHWPSDTYAAVVWGAAALALAVALRPAFGR
ncbi:MAG: phosphatase PAP2 family protein, partial [Chloroflexi bacterium]|nr:phosphatase PAP2 family protein [Chloroflexota bacterium]